MKPYFVTGTDTGVGKTKVTESLLHYFSLEGKKTLGLKPVASGTVQTLEGCQNEDALALIEASSAKFSYSQVNPYVFEPAIAPHIAAAQSGRNLSLVALSAWYQNLNPNVDLVFIEGAGGWKCPLNMSETLADFVAVNALPVILVVGMRLGCINHAVISAESIIASGAPLQGWIANILDPEMPALEENIKTLEHFLPCPKLATRPYSKVISQGFQPGHRLNLLVK